MGRASGGRTETIGPLTRQAALLYGAGATPPRPGAVGVGYISLALAAAGVCLAVPNPGLTCP